MSKQALLVIDMQNDFLLPSAKLCVADGMACLPKVIEAVEAARAVDMPIIWVVREHDPSGIDVDKMRVPLFLDGGAGFCIPGTSGCQLVDGLTIRDGETKLVKKRFSAFFGTTLDALLRRRGIETVTLCGVQTPNCIRGTAWDAVALDYDTVMLEDATASKDKHVQAANVADMRAAGIRVLSVEQWKASIADVYE